MQRHIDMDESVHVAVNESNYLCALEVRTRFEIDPDSLYGIITDPDNARLFRSIKGCTYREVLVDEGTRQKVEVEHSSGWRFLMFHGTFNTRLIVEQDSVKRIMAFQLKPGYGGIMQDFQGSWLLEGAPGPDGAPDKASIATLRQKIKPGLSAPGFDWVVCGVSKRQLSHLIEDLKAEVRRINKGMPIPEYQLRKLERNVRKPVKREVEGFAIEVSDSDGEEPEADRDTVEDKPQGDEKVATSPSQSDAPPTTASPAKAAVVEHTWELLAALERLGPSAAGAGLCAGQPA